MADKQNPKKIKIIQFKDVVSLFLILVIFSCSVLHTFAASSNSIRESEATVISANDLLTFNYLTNAVYNSSSYKKIQSNNLKNLKFYNEQFPQAYRYLNSEGWTLANYTTVGTITKDNNKFPMTVCTFIQETDSKISLIISYKCTTTGKGFDMLLSGKLFDGNWKQNILNLIKKDQLNTGNWGQDIVAILLGYTGMEDDAQDYALNVARYYNKIKGNKTLDIHVTGHSLGGYLAQIGGAKLLQNATYKRYVKQVTYFNGFGLYVNNPISSTIWKTNIIATAIKNKIKQMYGYEINVKHVDSIIQNAYLTLKKNKSIVTLYRIKGDWCSPLGHHAGNIKEFYASDSSFNKYQTNQSVTKLKTTLTILHKIGLFKIDCSDYPTIYKIASVSDYMWAVHDLPAFQGYDLDTEIGDINVRARLYSVPVVLRKNSTDYIYLDIELSNAQLINTLQASNFKVSNKIKIQEVKLTSGPTIKQLDAGTYTIKYMFRIKVKAQKLDLLPTITLKENALKIKPYTVIQGLSAKLNIKNKSLSGKISNTNYFEIMDT